MICTNIGEMKKKEISSNHSSLKSVNFPLNISDSKPPFVFPLFASLKLEFMSNIDIALFQNVKIKTADYILLISSDFDSYPIHFTST